MRILFLIFAFVLLSSSVCDAQWWGYKTAPNSYIYYRPMNNQGWKPYSYRNLSGYRYNSAPLGPYYNLRTGRWGY